jgi:hypothetical protein
LQAPTGAALSKRKNPAGKSTSISFINRQNLPHWRAYAPLPANDALELSGKAQKVYKIKLRQLGCRLVFLGEDKTITVTMVAVGKRNRNEVYDLALSRMRD